MASRADLSTRVRAVLDSRQPRGRAGLGAIALASAAAVALALTISPLRIAAAPQTGDVITVTPAPKFVARTSLVVEDVAVTDENNNSIEGLTAADFAVAENGIAQHIALFEFQALADSTLVKSYYIIGYYAQNDDMDGRYRAINVTCARPAAKVQFRSGYYAGKQFSRSTAAAAPSSSSGLLSQAPPANQEPPATFAYPEVIHKVEAAYSDRARKAKFEGTCVLMVNVGANGRVADAKVQRILGLGLDEQALEAVKGWTFKPGRHNGQPIAMWAEVEFNFRLL